MYTNNHLQKTSKPVKFKDDFELEKRRLDPKRDKSKDKRKDFSDQREMKRGNWYE